MTEDLDAAFLRSYYQRGIHWRTSWLGYQLVKYPTDLLVYADIITETHPDVLIETGTFTGGSALFFATVMHMLNRGRVLTIDTNLWTDYQDLPHHPAHPRITYLQGDSSSLAARDAFASMIRPGERVMVSLDAQHEADFVQQELSLYGPLVTPGCYLVVEDTNINGHPIEPSDDPSPDDALSKITAHGGGPWEAVERWLATPGVGSLWGIDTDREKYILTNNPSGWLKRLEGVY